jgi:HAD superfamily hydrolase (TIGR01662 family)
VTAKRLAAILDAGGPILLDFDGPVTPLLPPPANGALAEAARRPLRRAGVDMPADLEDSSDHLAVLRFAGSQSPELARCVDTVCTRGEVEAARRSEPTPGAHNAMRALRRAGHTIVIVSNNSTDAVETYLQRHGVDTLVSGVVGRRHGQPELMKPDPDPVERALRILDAEPASCILVGDSVTDVEVSRRVGMRSIGYAKTPQRGTELAEAGADAIVDDMAGLSGADAI